MAALQRAVALEQVHDVAMRICKYLYLDVPAPFNETLEQHAVVTEGLGGLATRASERVGKLHGRAHDAHPLTAAARRGLDQQWKAHASGLPLQVFRRLLGVVVTREHRDAGGRHQPPRLALRSHLQDR